mmetsp:Transcript_68006/g.102570  ORF Transcript_68006/g.102570 Transcript_68006/m.102570 type:complete len:227 (+) Transcript_68006:1143-1823(+)
MKSGSSLMAAYASSISSKATDNVSGMYCPPHSPNLVALFSAAHSLGTCPSFVAWFSQLSDCFSPVTRWAVTSRIALALSSVEASSPSLSIAFKMALPTTTPSAMLATPLTISGVEIPKPTASGKSVFVRTRLMKSSRSGGSESLAPVTPVTETQYKNVEAISVKEAMRLSLLVGATKGTLESPYLMQALFNTIPSSGGKSTTMNPSAPASLACLQSSSSPYCKKGL